jgi:hypothetical protein
MGPVVQILGALAILAAFALAQFGVLAPNERKSGGAAAA